MKSLSLAQPHMLVMVGIPGAGKTQFAEKFAETFQAPRLEYNAVAASSKTPTLAHNVFVSLVKELLKTKSSIIVDGFSDTRTDRVELSRLARTAGYALLFIWVQTDFETAAERLKRPTRTSQREPISNDVYIQLLRRFTPLSLSEKSIVISGKHTYASQVKVILKKLISDRERLAPLMPPTRQIVDNREHRRRTIL